jgi:2-(1,2-epoxy-1,2-dihydrophenyl)acetyl-CoA isomerase
MSAGHDSDVLRRELRGATAWITLNRPDARNALNEALMDALVSALDEVAVDASVRCVVLTGAPPAFSAGGDVKDRQRRWDELPPSTTVGSRLGGMIDALRRRTRSVELLHLMPKPTIAMVNGAAAGAGFALALACDFRIVSDIAFATTAYANNALCGDFGMTYFLSLLVGTERARRLLMLSGRLSAAALLEQGLVGEVISAAELEAATAALADRLAAGPTFAYGKMKANLAVAASASLAAVLDAEAVNTRLTGLTEDGQEAVRALTERRPPRFAGR